MPSDHDPLTMIRSSVGDSGSEPVPARLLVREGAAASLRRRGEVADAQAHREVGAPEGWDVVDLSVTSLTALAQDVCAAGVEVRVLRPPELRDLVVAQLQAVIDAHALDPHWEG